MKDYRTIRYATSNENGVQELALESELTLWEQLKLAVKNRTLNPPRYVEMVYEVHGTYWVEKTTGLKVDQETQFECFEAKGWIRANSNAYKEMVHE